MIGPLKPFNTIGVSERAAVNAVLDQPILSGFLAGKLRGGKWVCALEDLWCETFGVKHAVACNSATSGLLAACAVLGVGFEKYVAIPALTMSATAAAPKFLRATLQFCDVEEDCFCISKDYGIPDVIIVTNLFGQPTSIGRMTDIQGVKTIEDNAQSIFATNYGKYAGTIADIGVFSTNVHKILQSGEGGIITTNDDMLAEKARQFINHAEMFGSPTVGLNLRMTELTAALAHAQLRRGRTIVQTRIEQAERLIEAIGEIPGLRHPIVRRGCTHVYYVIPWLVEKNRAEFVAALAAEGIPLIEGYVEPLYRLPAFSKYARPCPVAEDLHDRRLFLFENCAYDLTRQQIKLIGEAFKRAAEKWLR